MSATFKIEQMNATEAKNRFGDVLEKAARNKAVSVMKHGKPAAYVIPPAMYERMVAQLKMGPDVLDRLEREFDSMVEQMQTAASLEAAKSLMTVDTAALRQTVRRAARTAGRRGR